MPKKKTKKKRRTPNTLRSCPWGRTKAEETEAHVLAATLLAGGDLYVEAACEVVATARDGGSRKRVTTVEKALAHQRNLRRLFAFLDPTHYATEVSK